MTFRVDRLVSEENVIVLHVSGRVDVECVNTIKELTEEKTTMLALNLSEVTLASRDATTFLAACERGSAPLFFVGGLTKNKNALPRSNLPNLCLHRLLDSSPQPTITSNGRHT